MRTFANLLGLSMLLSMPAVVRATPTSTLMCLQAAFEAEVNAARTFSAFAHQAEQEGLAGVGRLFQAVALAENVHAEKHAEVIRSLGGQPRAALAEVEVKSTRENLRAAIARDTFDREAMYPTLLGVAREVGDTTPRSTLGVAMFMEKIHVKLFEEALRSLDAHVDTTGEFCVSRRSGYVSASPKQATGCVMMADGSLDRVQ